MTGSSRRTYVDGPFGQIHLRMTPPVAGATPLVCLHATAYSSRTFAPLMRAVAGKRQVIAVDLPGYGQSDAPAQPVDIADYASAVAQAIRTCVGDGGKAVALLGYHTGAYVATELAVIAPDLVDSLILIGIPYFQVLDLDEWKRKLATRHELREDLTQFEERWRYLVAERAKGVPLRRAFDNFLDELQAWPNGWWAHEAMFNYDSDARLPLVSQPVLVLNPAGHLSEPSRAAAALMPDARVEELPHIAGPVLELAPDVVASMAEHALSESMGA